MAEDEVFLQEKKPCPRLQAEAAAGSAVGQRMAGSKVFHQQPQTTLERLVFQKGPPRGKNSHNQREVINQPTKQQSTRFYRFSLYLP